MSKILIIIESSWNFVATRTIAAKTNIDSRIIKFNCFIFIIFVGNSPATLPETQFQAADCFVDYRQHDKKFPAFEILNVD